MGAVKIAEVLVCQTVRRSKRTKKDTPEGSRFFRMSVAVPLLPADRIERGYACVRDAGNRLPNLTPGQRRAVSRFCAYLTRFWLTRVIQIFKLISFIFQY